MTSCSQHKIGRARQIFKAFYDKLFFHKISPGTYFFNGTLANGFALFSCLWVLIFKQEVLMEIISCIFFIVLFSDWSAEMLRGFLEVDCKTDLEFREPAIKGSAG